MGTYDKLDKDLKEAMQTKDAERLSTLRLLKNAIKNAEIAKKEELTEPEILSVLDKQVKQRQDAIEQYSRGNRADLADKEKSELELIQSYLPEKISEEDVRKIVEEAIVNLGASSISDMGMVMKEVMAKTAGSADGKTVSDLVRKQLI